jgi:phosphate starvation-inducible PhoH-like protein
MSESGTLTNTIRLRDTDEERALLGNEDRTLRLMRRYLGVKVFARGGLVTLEGDEHAVLAGVRVVEELLQQVRAGNQLSAGEVEGLLRRVREDREVSAGADAHDDGRILRALDDTVIRPRTPGQKHYVDLVRHNDIVFAIGPAGTGKTYLAVAIAIRMMKRGVFRRLVLVRPAVEAGEHLGFLPGDLNAKVSPYLRPLHDAIGDFLTFSEVRRYLDRDIIEVVPLAYMRGRTLDNAFIILDEGQNTTPAQMKMFLTRMGRGSRIVVTGDITQTDLARGALSGLVDVQQRLGGIDGIGICRLTPADIVRHPLVSRIVAAYGSTGDDDAPPGKPSEPEPEQETGVEQEAGDVE